MIQLGQVVSVTEIAPRRSKPSEIVDYVFERPVKTAWPRDVPWPKVRTRLSRPGYGYHTREEAKRAIQAGLAQARINFPPVSVQLYERRYTRAQRNWAWACEEKAVPL